MSSIFYVIKSIADAVFPIATLLGGLNPSSNRAIIPTFNSKGPGIPQILSKDVTKMAFYLYPNPRDLKFKEAITIGKPDSILRLKASKYNINLPLILLIHGFVTNSQDEFAQLTKDVFLKARYPGNIITVDWGALSTPKGPTPYLYYNLAAENVPLVAGRTAEFIKFLLSIKALKSLKLVHIIGFSLGAHVAGITGKYINSSLGIPVQRITGIDPAGPEFQVLPSEKKLDSTDALFVDVYHTNQGMKGYLGVLGHADFFPNGGGPIQPGCTNDTDISDVFTGTCSHAKGYIYFAESIRNQSIKGCKCSNNPNKDTYFASKIFVDDDCKMNCHDPVTFGLYCPPTARGTFYVDIPLLI